MKDITRGEDIMAEDFCMSSEICLWEDTMEADIMEEAITDEVQWRYVSRASIDTFKFIF
jgi:hypothetical protein